MFLTIFFSAIKFIACLNLINIVGIIIQITKILIKGTNTNICVQITNRFEIEKDRFLLSSSPLILSINLRGAAKSKKRNTKEGKTFYSTGIIKPFARQATVIIIEVPEPQYYSKNSNRKNYWWDIKQVIQ